MIDGDIAPSGAKPNDVTGEIRVQPVFAHETQHFGVIIHLRNIKDNGDAPFRFFASDLRKQWLYDGKQDDGLFS
jgi:hypothetical protein